MPVELQLGACPKKLWLSLLMAALLLSGCGKFQKSGASPADLANDRKACEAQVHRAPRQMGRPRLPRFVFNVNQCLAAKGWILKASWTLTGPTSTSRPHSGS